MGLLKKEVHFSLLRFGFLQIDRTRTIMTAFIRKRVRLDTFHPHIFINTALDEAGCLCI